MTILGFLTGTNPQRVVISRDVKDAPGLTLDAAISINPKRQLSISKNPVESGGQITDHATLGNLQFSLEGVISEAPLPTGIKSEALGILAGSAGGAIGTTTGGLAGTAVTAVGSIAANTIANIALSPDIPENPSTEFLMANRIPGDTDFPKKAWTWLLSLQQSRELLKVQTRLMGYTQLLISSLSAPQTSANGKSIIFSAEFEQVQIVKSTTITLPENVISADATGASSKAGLGKQAAGEATESQTKNVSVAKQILNKFGG